MHHGARRFTLATRLAVAAALILVAGPAFAQIKGRAVSGRTEVSGTVVDPDGNGLEGVLIRFVNQDTTTKNTQIKTKTGKKAGKFIHRMVEFGSFKIYAEKEGYKIVSYKIENRASDDSDAGSYGPVRFGMAREPRIMALQSSGLAVLEIVMATNADYDRLSMEAAQAGGERTAQDDKVERRRHPAEIGRELFSLKNYEAALEKFQEALKEKDGANDSGLHFAISRTYYHLEDYVKAEQYIRTSMELASTPPRGAHFYRALIAHKQGRTREAVTFLEQEIAGVSAPPATMLATLGSLYRDIGETAKAIKALDRAVSVDPTHLNALLTLGSLYVAEGNQTKAESYFQKAADVGASAGQSGATVFFNLGAVNYNQKEYRTAAEAYERAVQIDPTFADAFLELGYTLRELNENVRAVDAFEKYLELAGSGATDRDMLKAWMTSVSRS